MKKAEEIAVEVGLFKSIEAIKENFGLQITRDCYIGTSKRIIRAIKQAQIDAIDATVKKCAEKAEMQGYYNEPCKGEGIRLKRLKRVWQNRLFKVEVDVSIDKQSILQVAEQLKKELE